MIKRLSISLVLAVVMAVSVQYPALAVESPSGIEVESIMVFRNVAESDDMAVIFHYNITYNGTYPSTPASKTIAFRLYSENGSELLGTSKPCVFFAFDTNGYGDGCGSFYFTAADNITWGKSYRINILCTPTYFDPPQSFTHTLTSTEYSDAETKTESQEDMRDYIMSICDTFRGVYPDVALKSGLVLSVYGESYFRGAIQGLQQLCPQLFFVQDYVPEELEVEEYDTSLPESYSARLVGSDVMTGAKRVGEILGISGKFFLALLNFAVCIVASVITMRKGWGLEAGLFLGVLITVCAAILIGDTIFTVLMVVSLIAAIGIMYIFVLKRA